MSCNMLGFGAARVGGNGCASTYTDWASLVAGLTGAGDVGFLQNVASGNLITIAQSNGTEVLPIAPINLANVTSTKFGEIASGSGTTYTLVGGHNLPASGTGRPWDTPGSTEAGADVSFTVVSNTLTLGASRTMAAGDLFYQVGSSEFEIGSADAYRPLSGAYSYFSGTGLYLKNGNAEFLVTSSQVSLAMIPRVTAKWTGAAFSVLTVGARIAAGFRGASNNIAAGGIVVATGPTVYHGIGVGAGPSFYATSAGTPVGYAAATSDVTFYGQDAAAGRFAGGTDENVNWAFSSTGVPTSATYAKYNAIWLTAERAAAEDVDATFTEINLQYTE